MAEIIQFPGGEEQIRLEMERLLEDSLRISNPAVRKCVKERVGAVLAKHRGIPTLSISVTLPAGVTEASIQPVIVELQNEYRDKVTAFAFDLVKDICLLEARLCKVEHGLA